MTAARGATGLRARAVALALALASGVPPAAAAQWYVHYQRGLELAAAGRCAEAVEDFAAAERLGPRPQARVRTYGSEFLFAYDPRFHRAACLAELGRWEEGLALLPAVEAAGVTAAGEAAALRARLQAQRDAARRPAPAPAGSAAEGRGQPTPAVRGTSPPGEPAAAPRGARGRLAVDSRPAGAEVSADGRRLGVTPLAPVPLAAGSHRVWVSAPGHEPWEQEVATVAGETLRLEVALRPAAVALPAEAAAPTGGAATARERASGAGGPPGAEGGGPPPADPAAAALPGERGGAGEDGGGGAPPETPAAGGSDAAAREAAGAPAEPAGAVPPAVPERAAGGRLAALAALAAAALALAGSLAWLARRRRRAAGGRRLGPYRLLAELGRGGMATTWRAVRLSDGLPVAVKLPHAGGDATYPERFLREGRLGERLHHPNLVRILDAGEDAGTVYLVMELVPGRTLRAELDAAGPAGLPLPRVLEIATAVAEALDYAHGKGVVHRDLKPENVMVLPDGAVKVLDLGVARVEGQAGLTTSQVFLGSPLYAAPELVEPQRADARADLYSLGAMLFEMVAGRPPFVHESVFRLLELHQHAPLPARETLPRPVPAGVWELIERLLAKDPAARPESAEALLVALRRLRWEAGGEGARPAAAPLAGDAVSGRG